MVAPRDRVASRVRARLGGAAVGRRVAGIAAAVSALGPAAAAAQEPIPRDSLPADTVVIEAGDSLPAQEPGPELDTLSVPTMPVLPVPPDSGWIEGVTRWDRDALLSSTASTLSDLLARVSGLHALRFGYIGAPEAVTTAGAAAGAVEVYWDGYRLDPLGAGTVDLGRIELASLESVRVERSLDAVRIHLTTRVADDRRPYSRVEAATGDLDTEVFTGVALLPKVFWGPLGLGVSRVETDGRGGVEGAVALNAFAHWGVTRERWGLRLQARLDDLRRDANHPLQGDSRRIDVVGLFSADVAPGVVVEAFAGRTEFTAELPDTLEEDPASPDTMPPDTLGLGGAGPRFAQPEVFQAGVRLGALRGPAYVRGELRWRDEGPLPALELGLRGGVSLADRFLLGAGVSHDRWSDGPDAATSWDARAAVRVVGGLEFTGAIGDGDIGVPFAGPDAGDSALVVVTSPRRTRVGGRLTLGPLRVGAGRVTARADTVVTLGLGFDPRGAPLPGTDVRGWEVAGMLSAGSWPFRVEGWLEDWSEGDSGPYLPVRAWRAGLVYDHLPLESDNLHIYAGLFHSRRGAALYPVPHVSLPGEDEPPPAADLVEVPGVQTLDFLLNVRVVSVRLFFRWENMLLEDGEVFPGRPLLRQRVITGLRWDFYN
ncbi:MAG TPA: TonB-dependent receptor plug domain-containing protein [Longimicrobiales bacterium]|nr:TonB-dependent receptor plug domain-containing protein [Longimicrobiales bacterium]